MYKQFLKRFFDFLCAFITLIILFPVLIVITFWLHFANKGAGAFFTQQRPGKNGRIFKIVKFKTMNDNKDKDGNLLSDAERLTKIGRIVRSTSIDELPQLINVIKGDMSFIGPRPLLIKYLPLYSMEQARRHNVRPGITGWAQVNGRNLCLLSKKFEYDVWYVDNISLKLDIKIIFLTIKNILCKKDIGSGSGDMKQVDDLNFKKQIIENMNNGK